MPSNHRIVGLWLLVLILLLGAALLVHDLDALGLWVDEGWSVTAAQQPDLAGVTRFVADDVHPPFYFYLLHIWYRLAGDTVFALRYLTVLAALATAAAVYRLGRALFDQSAGVLAALLFILHDLVLVLGQEIRQYPQSQLLTALAIWLYWRFWRDPSPRRGIVFGVVGTALLWTNYWGGFVLLALFIHALVTKPSRLRAHCIAIAAIGVSFLPWLPALYTQVTQGIPGGIGHGLSASEAGYKVLAFQLLGRPEPFWGALAFVGLLDLRTRRWRPTAASILPALVIVLTVGLSLLINLFYATLSFRVLSLIIPPLVVLVARAITSLRRYGRLVLAAIAVLLSLTLTAARPPTHLPWEAVAAFVADHSASGDAALAETWFDSYAFAYYLDQQNTDIAYIPSELERRARSSESFETYIRQSLADHDGLWVVRFSSDGDISQIIASEGLTRTATINWETELTPIDLRRFDRITSSPPQAVFGGTLQLADTTLTVHEDEVTLNMLWLPTETPQTNYTVSVFLLDSSGALVSQNDSYPLDNRSPTTTWTADQHYFDSHLLDTAALPPGTYQLGLKVYIFTDTNFQDIEILPPEPCEPPCEYIILDTVEIPPRDGS